MPKQPKNERYEGFLLGYQHIADKWRFGWIIDDGDLPEYSKVTLEIDPREFKNYTTVVKEARLFADAKNEAESAWGCFCNCRMTTHDAFRCAECHCLGCESCMDNDLCPECREANEDEENDEQDEEDE